MTEEVKPITSTQFAKKEDRTVQVGANPTPSVETATASAARDQQNDQKIKVRALRTFHENANMHGKMVQPGDEFECQRGRAAELRANGLIEYVSDGHDKEIHGEIDAKRIGDRVSREQEMAKLPENAKTTPLRNPELKLADVPAGSDRPEKTGKK